MHELSIALNIVDMATHEARKHRGRIVSIHLKLGQLAGVVSEALISAFELAREQEAEVAAAELKIEDIPVAVYCPTCATERAIEFPEFVCPICRQPTPEVIRGREMEVTALELE